MICNRRVALKMKGKAVMSTATNLSPTTTFTSRQRVILLVLLGAGFLVSVDFSIFNVALPETGAGIGMQLKDWPWIASAYALPSAGLALERGLPLSHGDSQFAALR